MKILFTSILCTSILFLIIDAIWLTYAVKLFYRPNLGNLLNDKPVIWAAILFYLVYFFCLSMIVIKPSLEKDSISYVFWLGLLFGVACYGTYNLTNMATIKNWSVNVVIVDMIWGGLLTGITSSVGVILSKKIFF
tara:strand:+ start:103 stop:507 length:405 start_codon:yes stop_codon:yes gene_type:complete